ncbi:MAG: substrate-binding domain-containing protein [Spirochaetota bacterium]
MKKLLFAGLLFSLCSLFLSADTTRLKLATTTSTENSGLLSVLLPVFEKESGCKVDVIAVGTGKAIKLGENGDVDVVLVHARDLEDKFVADGFGVNRRDVMHNDFVIIGPENDPAGIGGLKSASEAFARIARSGMAFISRGDDSGTHVKEKEIWSQAGITPQGRWYKEVGQGMGAVITMSNDLSAYAITDRGTYIAMKGKIALKVLVEGDLALFNPYGIIAVNPAKHPGINFNGAMKLINWITSVEGQDMIRNYTINQEVLFFPNAVK